MPITGYHICCPICANKRWICQLYEPRSGTRDFLKQYSAVFNTVEGNTTFYGLPSAQTVSNWNVEVRKGFRFCFKVPRTISHEKRLVDAETETEEVFKALSPLGEHLGPFFLLLPPSFGPGSLPELDRYLASLPDKFSYVVEVRHPEFFLGADKELNALLLGHRADRVLYRASGSDVPHPNHALGQHPFVRFMSQPQIEDNIPSLKAWAETVAVWIREGRAPFFFLHHAPDDLHAPRLARLFHDLLAERADVGKMPDWPSQGSEQEQLDLF